MRHCYIWWSNLRTAWRARVNTLRSSFSGSLITLAATRHTGYNTTRHDSESVCTSTYSEKRGGEEAPHRPVHTN